MLVHVACVLYLDADGLMKRRRKRPYVHAGGLLADIAKIDYGQRLSDGRGGGGGQEEQRALHHDHVEKGEAEEDADADANGGSDADADETMSWSRDSDRRKDVEGRLSWTR